MLPPLVVWFRWYSFIPSLWNTPTYQRETHMHFWGWWSSFSLLWNTPTYPCQIHMQVFLFFCPLFVSVKHAYLSMPNSHAPFLFVLVLFFPFVKHAYLSMRNLVYVGGAFGPVGCGLFFWSPVRILCQTFSGERQAFFMRGVCTGETLGKRFWRRATAGVFVMGCVYMCIYPAGETHRQLVTGSFL